MNMNIVVVETGRELPADALAIGVVLPVAIELGRELGWSSDRTFREAEAWATRGRRD